MKNAVVVFYANPTLLSVGKLTIRQHEPLAVSLHLMDDHSKLSMCIIF